LTLALALLAAACMASTAEAKPKRLTPTQKTYLRQAERGVANARRYWWDSSRHWYRDRRGSHSTHPLATIWGIVPLFEAVNAIQIASPGHRRTGGRIWFDDNGWWGLAFFDAYRATHSRRALDASRRALSFIMKA